MYRIETPEPATHRQINLFANLLSIDKALQDARVSLEVYAECPTFAMHIDSDMTPADCELVSALVKWITVKGNGPAWVPPPAPEEPAPYADLPDTKAELVLADTEQVPF